MKLHLKQSMEARNNLSLILRDCSIYSVSLYSLDVAVKLDHPLKCNELGTEVLGSCDGLVLLYNGEKKVCIWNPSTTKHQKLPVTKIEFPVNSTICQYIIYGLGYDSVSDDYKVVRMIQFYGNSDDNFGSEVKVYSQKWNSWRRIKDFPYYLCYKRCYGKFSNGALHWIVTRKYEEVDPDCSIAAFDLGTEEYRLVPMPDFGSKKFHLNVEVLNGCLCLLCNQIDHHVDVWVMKEYGVKQSWTMLFSVAQPKHITSFQCVVPLAYSKNGSQVLLVQDNKKLVWFDLDHNVVKEINVCGLPDYFEPEVCVQSLVHLPQSGASRSAKRKKKKRQAQKQKKTKMIRDDFLSEGIKLESSS